MARSIYAVTCLVALAAASQAEALQVTNRDSTEYKMSITEKSGTQDMIVKASQVLDGICGSGCTIKMPDGEEYEYDGNEIVSIEDGFMYLDEPSDSGLPDTGTDIPPAEEGKEK